MKIIGPRYLAIVLALAAALALAACGSSVAEQDAAQVAASLGATGFTYCGESSAVPGVTGGVASDVAWLHGEKYGIEVFTSATTETEWLQLAEPLGVAPAASGPNWVAYPSLHPDQPGCP